MTKEELKERMMHSLKVKRDAKKRIEEQWAREGLTGNVVLL